MTDQKSAEPAELEAAARREIAAAGDAEGLQQAKARYLGRKGRVQALFGAIPGLQPEERRGFGQRINAVKDAIEAAVAARAEALEQASHRAELAAHAVDVTLPGRRPALAPVHPITAALAQVESVFSRLGFEVADGPEVEYDDFNFTALNFPPDHPARDMQDTLFVADPGDVPKVMRTHTSPVQVRTMLQHDPPVRVICPGKVYRRDTPDASHSPVFHQVEGLMVGHGVSFAELKGVLRHAVKELFGTDRLRFRASFFPFTEPSAEVDMECFKCGGAGCGLCGRSGWIEILGSGMVDPNVFRAVGYPEDVTGWAFGMGVERIAMLLHGIDDIRLFYGGDLRFLAQFSGLGTP